MPPNLAVKAGFVRGELENIDESALTLDEKETIRTAFILQNVYSYMLRNTRHFDSIHAKNKKEERVLKELEEIINDFLIEHGHEIKDLCVELIVTEDTLDSAIIGVTNVLFCDGLTWSRVIALFLFIGELTTLCLSRKFHERIVDRIYECFYKLVKEQLMEWVDDHGGWEAVLILTGTKKECSCESSKSGWAKSLLYSTFRMIGTLAHVVNSSNHTLP